MPELYVGMLHAAMILAAIPYWCNITSLLVRKNLIKNIDWFATASFFVYLIHIPFILPQVKKLLYYLTNPQSQEMLAILYFGVVFGTIAIALVLYWIMQKLCPRFTKVITGGR